MDRNPAVAGRFYNANASALAREILAFLHCHDKVTSFGDSHAGKEYHLNNNSGKSSWAWMLPHAGHIYCGEIIGKTLAKQVLPSTLVIICPNHTGHGHHLSVWPDGSWKTPLGNIDVDTSFTSALVNHQNSPFAFDIMAHLLEHSIEVILPFLWLAKCKTKNLQIVPVCVGTQQSAILENAGKFLADVLAKRTDIGLVISSDMNHFENEDITFKKDSLAIEQILAGDPNGLLNVIGKSRITMCGAGPMALAMYCANNLGKLDAELVCHDTSATVSGDKTNTVGYAGLRFHLRSNNYQTTE